MEYFKGNLIWLKKKYNYTQEELADLLNVSRQSISKWERGEGFPDIINLLELARIYNVTLDELTSRDISSERIAIETDQTLICAEEFIRSDVLPNNDCDLLMGEMQEVQTFSTDTEVENHSKKKRKLNRKYHPSITPTTDENSACSIIKERHTTAIKRLSIGAVTLVMLALMISVAVLGGLYGVLKNSPDSQTYLTGDINLTELKIAPQFDLEIYPSANDYYMIEYPTVYNFNIVDGVGEIELNELSEDYFDKKSIDLVKIYVPEHGKLETITIASKDEEDSQYNDKKTEVILIDLLLEKVDLNILGASIPSTSVENCKFNNISVDTMNGSIDISSSDVLGNIIVDTMNGSTDISNTKVGENITVDTMNGNIDLSYTNVLENIIADTMNGDVNIDNIITGKDLTAETMNGKIAVQNSTVERDLIGKTLNGNVLVSKMSVGNANLYSGSGKITAEFDSINNFTARTDVMLRLELVMPLNQLNYAIDVDYTNGKYINDKYKKIIIGDIKYDLSSEINLDIGSGNKKIVLEYQYCDSNIKFANT